MQGKREGRQTRAEYEEGRVDGAVPCAACRAVGSVPPLGCPSTVCKNKPITLHLGSRGAPGSRLIYEAEAGARLPGMTAALGLSLVGSRGRRRRRRRRPRSWLCLAERAAAAAAAAGASGSGTGAGMLTCLSGWERGSRETRENFGGDL